MIDNSAVEKNIEDFVDHLLLACAVTCLRRRHTVIGIVIAAGRANSRTRNDWGHFRWNQKQWRWWRVVVPVKGKIEEIIRGPVWLVIGSTGCNHTTATSKLLTRKDFPRCKNTNNASSGILQCMCCIQCDKSTLAQPSTPCRIHLICRHGRWNTIWMNLQIFLFV